MEYYKNRQVYCRCTFLVCVSVYFSQRGISRYQKNILFEIETSEVLDLREAVL